MTAMPATGTMTAEEFLALPLDRDEYGWAPCLVEGELVVTQPPLLHQRIVATLLHEIRKWTEAGRDRGEATMPLNVVIDDRNVYEPDLLWYAEERIPDDPLAGHYAVPDLAIEVRSPSTWRHDIGAKKSGYERKGLKELWLVDTASNDVLVFRRSKPSAPTFDVSLQLGPGDTLTSPLLRGFTLPASRLFGHR